MIRINLLGAPKPKNKRSSVAVSAVSMMEMGEAGSPKLKVAIVVALIAVINLGYWYQLDKQKKSLVVKMQAAEQKNRELQESPADSVKR